MMMKLQVPTKRDLAIPHIEREKLFYLTYISMVAMRLMNFILFFSSYL